MAEMPVGISVRISGVALAHADQARGFGELVLAIAGAELAGRDGIAGLQSGDAGAKRDHVPDRLDTHVVRWHDVDVANGVAAQVLVEDRIDAGVAVAHQHLARARVGQACSTTPVELRRILLVSVWMTSLRKRAGDVDMVATSMAVARVAG